MELTNAKTSTLNGVDAARVEPAQMRAMAPETKAALFIFRRQSKKTRSIRVFISQ
jgi:hypothetical protein